MSDAGPRERRTQTQPPPSVQPITTFVDTNVLLRKAIQKISPDVRNKIILRCDEMACLFVGAEAIELAFTRLLQLIARRLPAAQLYLSIRCSREGEESLNTGSDRARFGIQFHTNIDPDAAWMAKAEHTIASIASLLLPYGGGLQVNQLKNSGCVFCISLPGKQTIVYGGVPYP